MEDNKMSKDNGIPDKIQAIWNILGGGKGVDALIRGELIVSLPKKDLKALTTIKLNTGLKTKADFLEALKKVGCIIDTALMSSLEYFIFVPKTEEKEVEVVVIKAGDISFKDSICAFSNLDVFVKPHDLYLCSIESVFYFVLQYGHKIKNNEWFMVGMKPVVDGFNIGRIFCVRRDGAGILRITVESYTPHNFFRLGQPFLFLRPKPFCV